MHGASCMDLAALRRMTKELWCSVCNQAVSVGATRASAALAMSASGLVAAGIPQLFHRRRSSLLSLVMQAAMGAAAGYVAIATSCPGCSELSAVAVVHKQSHSPLRLEPTVVTRRRALRCSSRAVPRP